MPFQVPVSVTVFISKNAILSMYSGRVGIEQELGGRRACLKDGSHNTGLLLLRPFVYLGVAKRWKLQEGARTSPQATHWPSLPTTGWFYPLFHVITT